MKFTRNTLNILDIKKINLLEIGIADGDSLRVWREFFPKANILGLDINKKNFIIDNVEFFYGDQSNTETLKKITSKYKSFDIIIDDGSHFCKHVIKSFNFFYPFLNVDGLYVVEDLQTSYAPRYGGSRVNLNKKKTSMNFFKKMCDSLNYEHYDRPFYKKGKHDGRVKSIYFYQNIVLVKKGDSIKYYHPIKPKKNIINLIKKFISKFFD